LTIWRTVLATCVAALLLAGCGGGGDDETTTTALPEGCSQVPAPKPKQVQLMRPSKRLQGPTTARVVTSCGSFQIALDVARSPATSASFAYQAQQGVYDDTLFHRIIPGFVVQGGDPTGTGSGGPGYFVDESPPQGLSYTRGVVAMAKSPAEPPGRSGSQFFVVTATDAGLTPDYALLGRVSEGMDVVQRIESLGTTSGQPKAPVIIRSIKISPG
jgi:peptidyl-prolyl cis-trans isomerase B (cyclophilin B)